MKTVIIHGQSHKGTTCHIARKTAEKIGGETTEFFLPKDFGEFCCGCTQCFINSETKCPHFASLSPITKAIDEADVIILASPVYVFHATGAMKSFLDHYGWRWMVHRPDERMFKKQGVCISTAAGAGMRSTNKDMAHSLFYWGVAKIYKYGIGVAAVDWNKVSEKKKQKIEKGDLFHCEQNPKTKRQGKAGHKNQRLFQYHAPCTKDRLEQSGRDILERKGLAEQSAPLEIKSRKPQKGQTRRHAHNPRLSGRK